MCKIRHWKDLVICGRNDVHDYSNDGKILIKSFGIPILRVDAVKICKYPALELVGVIFEDRRVKCEMS